MTKRYFARIVLGAAVTALLSACSGGSGGPGPDAAADTLRTVALTGFPHSVDIYDIDDADKAVVVLHGGGGGNDEIANSLGLNDNSGPPTESSVDWAWLHAHKILAVFPQGQAIAQNPSAFTWTNHVMTSGENDLAFLQALAQHIRTQYGISKVYLLGHSNGGMMANRMWCESPTTFDGYVAIAGPASSHYLSTPCTPNVVKPYYGIVGAEDAVLQVNGDWDATTWQINPLLVAASSDAFVNSVVIGEWRQQLDRAQRMCGEQPQLADGISGGGVITWTHCGGSLKLQEVLQGGHAISSLETAAGFRILDAAAGFIDGLP